MTAIYKYSTNKLIRLGYWLSLIFFVLISACRQNDHKTISIVYKGKQAVAIAVPEGLVEDVDSIAENSEVRLKNNPAAIFGEYQKDKDQILFRPLIPLSPGLSYEVFHRNTLIGTVEVPAANISEAASLISVYPSADTLPDNLLKFYFQFSSPMREGEALQHIFLLDENKNTIPGVFLTLQPELWNKERTALTIWLDPGRIKRDLIPNKQLGNPLQKGKTYTLAVSKKWRDAQGLPLPQSYNRLFHVGNRDSVSPEIEKWQMVIPEKSTVHPLQIKFGEPLDYFLVLETIKVVDIKNRIVKGRFDISEKEMSVDFIPDQQWQAGIYKLKVAPHLEDLAGNNLERLFDRDIRVKNEAQALSLFIREFRIRD